MEQKRCTYTYRLLLQVWLIKQCFDSGKTDHFCNQIIRITRAIISDLRLTKGSKGRCIVAWVAGESCFKAQYTYLGIYLSDVEVAFQVITDDTVEFVCREERSLSRFCGDLKYLKNRLNWELQVQTWRLDEWLSVAFSDYNHNHRLTSIFFL